MNWSFLLTHAFLNKPETTWIMETITDYSMMKLEYFGHVMRNNISLEQLIMLGKNQEKSKIERQ